MKTNPMIAAFMFGLFSSCNGPNSEPIDVHRLEIYSDSSDYSLRESIQLVSVDYSVNYVNGSSSENDVETDPLFAYNLQPTIALRIQFRNNRIRWMRSDVTYLLVEVTSPSKTTTSIHDQCRISRRDRTSVCEITILNPQTAAYMMGEYNLRVIVDSRQRIEGRFSLL